MSAFRLGGVTTWFQYAVSLCESRRATAEFPQGAPDPGYVAGVSLLGPYLCPSHPCTETCVLAGVGVRVWGLAVGLLSACYTIIDGVLEIPL